MSEVDENADLFSVLNKRFPKKLLIAIAIFPAILALGIFAHIARYQLAHRESVCPFVHVRHEAIANSVVVEEKRRCLAEVEEHRWTVSTPVVGTAAQAYELGRYPLSAEHIATGYVWTARIENDRVEVHVQNPARGEFVLRAPPSL